ncbi:HAMP domain-containing methyl-accepting chemotaxis protein [Pigmentibacter ruber]|uniref:HAMP domain-containing methyl-accepting chemotaxis protein n=1 Tax=Pigmentibacter ruber TaxID=2683196 RepID=UPI00131AF682|nr:methyl-accepting chemotaxis protein [Pigmentibacter ruber]
MKKISLSFKLNLSLGILFFLILCISIYSILMINKTNSYSQNTGENWLPSIVAIGELKRDLIAGPRGLILYSLDWATNSSPAIKSKGLEEFNGNFKKFEDHLKNYAQFVVEPEEKEIYEKALSNWKTLNDSIQEIKKVIEDNKSPNAGFNYYREKMIPQVTSLDEELNKISEYNYKGGVSSTNDGAYLTSLTNISMGITIIISMIIGSIIFLIIKKSTGLIEKAIKKLKEQSVENHRIANELKGGSKKLENSVTEQSAAIHETTAAINEITSMVNRTAENARESTEVAKKASEKSEIGQSTMTKLVKAMETIQESNVQLQNIAVIINQINSKTAVINDIVSKTELLSLNASIESARAGEYGKGFAVVAEEVGNLAKISGKSANEIQELITASQEQVNKILELTKARVDDGKKVTSEAQDSFIKISADIVKMSDVIQQIFEATREQEIGVRKISDAMSAIDKATQNSSLAVKSTAKSSEELVEQSDKLDNTAGNISMIIIGMR